MARRLPPLNALRAFEAAARNLSFKEAAAELNVTPAAISHQVKALEEHLGVALFRRLNRRLLLTDAGQAALPDLRVGFDKLAAAAERLGAHRARGLLTVSVEPSFAAKWLVRRVDRFAAAHPEIDLRIDATAELVWLGQDGVDMGIRYGAGHYAGLRADRLIGEEVFPVCSPRLLDGPRPLRTPADLARHTLLHEAWESIDPGWPTWRMWLAAAGVEGVDADRGPRYSLSSMAIQAALEGHGVALAGSVVVADDLAAGRLVRPFALGFRPDLAYYLVSPEATAESPKVAAFRDWLLTEITAEPDAAA